MDFEYMRVYTDLRTAKMSFHQFMDFASAIYSQGRQNGQAQARTHACLEKAAGNGCQPLKLDYETVF